MANQRNGGNLSNDIDSEGEALSRVGFLEFQRETLREQCKTQQVLRELLEALAQLPLGLVPNCGDDRF